jgi:glycine oxidase
VASSIDIAVVGAGVVGCAVAYELTRRGGSVQLVDERPVGMGATQASAGVLAPYIEARAEGPLLDLTARSLALFDEFVAGVAAASGSRVEYRRTGTLDVAMQPETMKQFGGLAALLAKRGVEAEMVDAQAARSLEPHLAADVVGGLLIPSHGFVAASELTQALAVAARRLGAQVSDSGHVCRIRRSGDSLIVETSRGNLAAGRVVLAAGSWTGQIDVDGSERRVPVRPVRGQLLHLSWNGAMLNRVTWSERCYLVPWGDGTLLVGATVEEAGFNERTTVAGVRDLIEAASELVPHVWTAGFVSARVGLRPCTPDELPVIGPSACLPGLLYATGHYRNGVLLAPLTAKLVADAILDDRIDPVMEATLPQRFGKL